MTEQPVDQPPATASPTQDVPPTAGDSAATRLWRRTAGAAAVVAVLVIGNAAVNSSTASAAVGPSTSPARLASTAASGPGGGQAGADVTEPAALHGEFKVINRDGSVQLRRWQSGAVDAIDEISLTVRSADGFDGRYLLGPGVSVTGIGLGDDVTVVGAGQALPASE